MSTIRSFGSQCRELTESNFLLQSPSALNLEVRSGDPKRGKRTEFPSGDGG
jgi:hypothetical protein